MKIYNETVYSSDDIYNLFRAVDLACWRKHQDSIARWKAEAEKKGEVWKDKPYYARSPLPQEIRIGYRSRAKKPKPGDDVDAQAKPSFVTKRKPYSPSPRYGIVRPTDLPLNPLVILAQCAEGANRDLPREVVQALARAFSDGRRGSPTDDDYSDICDDHQITFALSVAPKAKAAAKVARKEARIATFKAQIREEQDVLDRLYAKGATARRRIADYKLKLAALEPKQEMALYV